MARHTKQKAHLARLGRAKRLGARNRTILPSEDPDRAGASSQEISQASIHSAPSELSGNWNNIQEEDSELSSEESSSDDEAGSESCSEELSENPVSTSLNSSMGDFGMLQWTDKAEKAKTSKRPYGSGSGSTEKRRRKHQRELGQAAEGTLNIASLFKRQQELAISTSNRPNPPSPLTPPSVVSQGALEKQERASAIKDLETLLRLRTEQIRKYGHIIFPGSDLFRRHCMIRSFLYIQQQTTGKTRQQMADIVAATFNRRGHTGKKIVTWEKQWIRGRTIPESRAGKHKACLSLLEDDGILCAVRDFAKTQGEGKLSGFLNLRWVVD